MILLCIMTLVNSVLKQYSFVNVNRWQVGSMQIGVIEIMLLIGFLWALVRGGINRSYYPSPVSPLILWLLGAFAVATAFGVLGAINLGVPFADVLRSLREFTSIPVCIVTGYLLTRTPRAARNFAKIAAIAGMATGTLLLMGFSDESETASLNGGLSALRNLILDWNTEYAAIAALLLIYCIVVNIKLLPRPVMLIGAIGCFLGYLCTLSRTSVVVMGVGTMVSYFILPRGVRVAKMLKAALLGVLIGFSIYSGLMLANAAIGRNFLLKVQKHFEQMLPRNDATEGPRAYDARFEAAKQELGLWLHNPLMGQGFACQGVLVQRGKIGRAGDGYNHNGWSSTLAKTGIFGFIAVAGTLVGMIVLGWRMVREATDVTDQIIGALSFCCGTVFFVRACCTMSFTSRAALDFGLVCGVILRYREIQLVKNAALTEYEYHEPDLNPADQVDWGYAPGQIAGHPM